MYEYIHIYVYTYIQICIYTYIYTYIHTYRYIYRARAGSDLSENSQFSAPGHQRHVFQENEVIAKSRLQLLAVSVSVAVSVCVSVAVAVAVAASVPVSVCVCVCVCASVPVSVAVAKGTSPQQLLGVLMCVEEMSAQCRGVCSERLLEACLVSWWW